MQECLVSEGDTVQVLTPGGVDQTVSSMRHRHVQDRPAHLPRLDTLLVGEAPVPGVVQPDHVVLAGGHEAGAVLTKISATEQSVSVLSHCSG